MEKFFSFISIFCFAIATAHADVSSSADYTMAALSIDNGGVLAISERYTSEFSLSDIAGRSTATLSDAMAFGFAAQLNNPPIAQNDLRSHPFDEGVDIPINVLLGNDLDADLDSLRILNFDTFSANGGGVIGGATSLHYNPPTNFRGIDQFSYTVIDPSGDVSTATVTMFIAPSDAGQLQNTVAIYFQSDGSAVLRFKQVPGYNSYRIEFSDNLEIPHWVTVQDTDSVDGIVEMRIDPAASKLGFYRAVASF